MGKTNDNKQTTAPEDELKYDNCDALFEYNVVFDNRNLHKQ